MSSTGGFDLLIQCDQHIVAAILARELEQPALLALQLALPKQIAFPPPPQPPQTLLWWEAPQYALDEQQPGTVICRLPLHGGVRDQQTIYSIGGDVIVRRTMQIAYDPQNAPYLTLAPPDSAALDWASLSCKVGGVSQPAGSIPPTALATLGGAVLPLLIALAQLPCTYVPQWPSLATSSRQAPSALSLSTAVANTIAGTLISIGAMVSGYPSNAATPMPTLVPPPTPVPWWQRALRSGGTSPNHAIALSSAALNALYRHLLDSGQTAGSFTLPSESATVPATQHAWQWQTLTIQIQQGYLTLAGTMLLDQQSMPFVVDLQLAVGERGRVSATPLAAQINGTAAAPDTLAPRAIATAFVTTLVRLFGLAAHAAEGRLVQRLVVPSTHIAHDIPITALVCRDDLLTILTTLTHP